MGTWIQEFAQLGSSLESGNRIEFLECGVNTMSRYLIRRIEETSAITLLPHTEIIALGGGDHLDRLTWRTIKPEKPKKKTLLMGL
jgi:hypothetical protein